MLALAQKLKLEARIRRTRAKEARMWKLALGVMTLVVLAEVSAAQQTKVASAQWITDANGCRIWNLYPKPKEFVTWSGACVDGVANGVGVLQWFRAGQPSEQFEGTLRDGRPQGRGIMRIVEIYDGEFTDGLPNGQGTRRDANGGIWSGQWVNGCFRNGSRHAAIGVDVAECK